MLHEERTARLEKKSKFAYKSKVSDIYNNKSGVSTLHPLHLMAFLNLLKFSLKVHQLFKKVDELFFDGKWGAVKGVKGCGSTFLYSVYTNLGKLNK